MWPTIAIETLRAPVNQRKALIAGMTWLKINAAEISLAALPGRSTDKAKNPLAKPFVPSRSGSV